MKLSYKIVKKYFTCILFLLCLSFPKCIQAQPLDLPPKLLDKLGQVATPHATDLGRFGDIPMSHYTGRANVTIPIKSYTYNGVTLDINLSYDTSGLKMNQLPGWVGPGWTLNAGGCITRSQMDFCDEMEFDPLVQQPFSNYFHAYQDLHNYNTSSIINQSLTKDYEPDLFYFNFLGKTGFFFLGDDGQWKVSSDCNLAVEFNVSASTNYINPPIATYPSPYNYYKYPKAIIGFKLYDDDGNRYTFGYDQDAIEYSIDYFEANNMNNQHPWVATSWYLTRVEDHFGNLLYDFSYWRGKFTAQLFKSDISTSLKHGYYNFWAEEHEQNHVYFGTLHLPVYLHQIHTYGGDNVSFMRYSPYEAGTAYRHLYPSLYNPNGTEIVMRPIEGEVPVQFRPYIYLQVRGDSLDKYRVVNDDGLYTHPLSALDFQLLKSITIGNGPSGYTCELDYDSLSRIHLSKVSMTITDISSIIPDTIQQYTLLYNDFLSVPQDYLTDAYDHWGYYRNPNNTNNEDSVRRNPDVSYAKKGMLTEIIYPTGGRSDFEYEMNTYRGYLSFDRQSLVSESGTGGGLRIKSIAEFDSPSSTQVLRRRSYSYLNPNTNLTSGELFQKPKYKWVWQNYNQSNTVMVYKSTPVLPLSTSSGVTVGYSYVKEVMKDGDSHLYHYSNFSDTFDELPSFTVSSTIATPYARFGELGIMRGKLLNESVSDRNQVIYLNKAYTYRQDETAYKNFYSNASNISVLLDIHDVGHIYKIYYFKYDLQNIITNTRQGNVLVSDTVSYEMGDFTNTVQFPTYFRKCVSERVARGSDNVQKNYTYRTESHDTCYIPLTTTSVYNGGVLQRTDKTIFRILNNHDVPHYETTWISSSFKDTLVTYNSFSDSGLPTKITRKGEPSTRFFWNSKGKLLASVTSSYIGYLQCTELIKNNDNPASQPDLSPLNVIKRNGTTIFDYPDTKATANIYYNNGLLYMSATGNGSYQYYYYDQLGRLTEIRDQNKKVIQRFTYNYSSSSAQ